MTLQKIPVPLLQLYKEAYEYYSNETLDDDVLVLPYDIDDIYNISPDNLIVSY